MQLKSLLVGSALAASLSFSSFAYAQDPAPTPPPAAQPAGGSVQLTEADLGKAIESLKKGETLDAMAKEKGVSTEVMNAAVLAQIEAAGAQAVQAGKITQAQADERIAPFRDRLGKKGDAPAAGEKPAGEKPPVETKIKPAPPPPPVERRVTTPVVVSGILAGTALVSGVVFAILAAGQHSKYEETPDHKVAVEGERNVFIADVSFGLAGLFGLAAIGLYLLPDEPQPAASGSPSGSPPPSAKKAPTWIRSALRGEGFRF